jgi:hypothetical protein
MRCTFTDVYLTGVYIMGVHLLWAYLSYGRGNSVSIYLMDVQLSETKLQPNFTTPDTPFFPGVFA